MFLSIDELKNIVGKKVRVYFKKFDLKGKDYSYHVFKVESVVFFADGLYSQVDIQLDFGKHLETYRLDKEIEICEIIEMEEK